MCLSTLLIYKGRTQVSALIFWAHLADAFQNIL